MGHATAILTSTRQMGATFGSVIIDLIIAERSPYHALRFGEQVDIYSARFQYHLQELKIYTADILGSGVPERSKQAYQLIISWINHQATIASFNDALFILGYATLGLLIMIICIMIFRMFSEASQEKNQ
jgi:hypothetical protein